MNPIIPNTNELFPISVGAVNGYLDYAREELQIRDFEVLAKVFLKLTDSVQPLVLGEVCRSCAQIKMLAKILLQNQKLEKDDIKRIQCPEHWVQSEHNPWADGTSRFTKSFNDEVSRLTGRLPHTDITYYMNIDWRAAGNCLRYTLQRLEPDRRASRMENLRRICVDETSYKKGRKYITVV